MQQPSNSPHERIGRYEVLRKIATGGMAELFLAKQVGMEGFEKVVAIKRILAHLAFDQEFINMFRDEARIVAKLSHPNIVQIYDLGKADDTYFIAMEYIPGRNLSSVAKKAKSKGQKLPPEYIARCIAQACEGLYYAHTRQDSDGRPLKIVHRDVSPQNIILAFSGGVKLVDFGIAKAATKIAHTRAGVLKGKYAYMSPEQIRGEEIDARSDLFAAGIVLYELLCGRRPFEKDNSIQTLKSIVQEPHVDCRQLNPEIPDTLAAIIDKALSKSVQARWQNAQELQVALEDYANDSARRSNNIAISKWVTDLFAEEISQDRGGSVVFKGIGEVILPAASEEKPEPERPAGHDAGVPLARGRGGGSIGERPPIQAPSLSMRDDPGASTGGRGRRPSGAPSRSGLIEEGVIGHERAERPEDAFSDDATALAGPSFGREGAGPVSLPEPALSRADYEEGALDRPHTPTPFDDSKTEHFSQRGAPDPADHEARPAARASGASLVRDESVDLKVDLGGTASIPRMDGSMHAAPSEDDGGVPDNPWDEATVGMPSGGSFDPEPDAFEEATSSAFATSALRDKAARRSAADGKVEVVEAPRSTGPADPIWAEGLEAEVSDAAHQAAPDGGDEQLWDDKTTTNDAYGASQAEVKAPVVVSDLSVPRGQMGGETLDVLGAPSLDEPLFGNDAAGDDPSSTGDEAVPGFEGTAEETASETDVPLDIELELPPSPGGPRKNMDLDARTMAGVTSDYLNVGLNVPEGGAYDQKPEETPTDDGASGEDVPARPKPKRGGQGLGQIKLSRKAQVESPPPKASAEKTKTGVIETSPEVEAAVANSETVQDDGQPKDMLDPSPSFSDDYEPTQANPSGGLLSPNLVAPRIPPPLNPPQVSSPGAMGIGSTNVPPANLSLSDMLALPSNPPRPPQPSRSRPGLTVSPASAPPMSLSAPTVEPMRGIQVRKIREQRERGPSVSGPALDLGDIALKPAEPVAPEVPPRPGRARRVVQMAALVLVLFVVAATTAYLLPSYLSADDVRLTVRTTPEGADIYLNGQIQSAKTPATLGGLQPGSSYELKVAKEGYEPAVSTVPIELNKPTQTIHLQLKDLPPAP